MGLFLEIACYVGEFTMGTIMKFINTAAAHLNGCTMKVKVLEGGKMPTKAHDTDSGFDLYVAGYEFSPYSNIITVFTGITVQLDEGWYCEVVPRSSITKRGMVLMNSVGIIDNSYRGEIIAVFKYFDKIPNLEIGERVVQLLVKRNPKVKVQQVAALSETQRGSGGFGSSGK